MTVDIFAPDWNVWDWVERDLEELRREVERHAGRPRHARSDRALKCLVVAGTSIRRRLLWRRSQLLRRLMPTSWPARPRTWLSPSLRRRSESLRRSVLATRARVS